MRAMFYDQMIDGMGITNTEFGNKIGLYGLTSIAFYFFGGIVADKFSSRKVLVFSYLITALGGMVIILSFMRSYAIKPIFAPLLGIIAEYILYNQAGFIAGFVLCGSCKRSHPGTHIAPAKINKFAPLSNARMTSV